LRQNDAFRERFTMAGSARDAMRYDAVHGRPSVDRAEQERLERGLMYVAMTRAEEKLAFTRSTLNGFASRIQQLLDHDVARAR
jgi:ATP-dependent exoDNAse (exonuclease V) beta subunit